jgi:hypothetical protein
MISWATVQEVEVLALLSFLPTPSQNMKLLEIALNLSNLSYVFTGAFSDLPQCFWICGDVKGEGCALTRDIRSVLFPDMQRMGRLFDDCGHS